MGCGSSHGHDEPIPSRELTHVVTETGENDSEENNTDKEKKKIALERCNNNNRNTEHCIEDGTRIHVPDTTIGEHSLEISHLSPNQQIAEKEHQRKERIRQEEESIRKANDEKGRINAEIKGLRDSLLKSLNSIKTRYDRTGLASYNIDHAVSRVRRCFLKTNGHEPNSLITTTIYHEKKKDLSKHQQEKARLLHRLSEIASAKLRHNNANLADLSDPNRASKLAERLSELYDNEWTDVFDAVRKNANKTDVPDRAIVESLIKILKFCYKMTWKLSTDQTQLLYKALYQGQTKTSSVHVTLQVQGLQKQTVDVSKLFFQKKIRQHVGQDLQADAAVSRISHLRSPLPKYIDHCSELSWYMHIQSPPMELDFDGDVSTTTRFRAYLSSGPTLYYVVWPALLLHEDGPLVAKGVAEYTHSNKNNIASGSSNTNYTGNESQW